MTNSGGEGGCFATGTDKPAPITQAHTSQLSQAEGPADTSAGSTNHGRFQPHFPFAQQCDCGEEEGSARVPCPGLGAQVGRWRAGPGNGRPVSGLRTASVSHTLCPSRASVIGGTMSSWKAGWLDSLPLAADCGQLSSTRPETWPTRHTINTTDTASKKKSCPLQVAGCGFFHCSAVVVVMHRNKITHTNATSPTIPAVKLAPAPSPGGRDVDSASRMQAMN